MDTYLLTWTPYGSWLPGDERGFVSRMPDGNGGYVIHNVPGEPYDADEPELRAAAKSQQKGPSVVLTRAHADTCREAFVQACADHALAIYAGAIMATHVHLVASSADSNGARLLNLFKGVASRRLGQRFGPRPSGAWWTRHGSRRGLRDGRAIAAAVRYVMEQPSSLVVFACDPAKTRDADVRPSRPLQGAVLPPATPTPPPEGGGSGRNCETG